MLTSIILFVSPEKSDFENSGLVTPEKEEKEEESDE